MAHHIVLGHDPLFLFIRIVLDINVFVIVLIVMLKMFPKRKELLNNFGFFFVYSLAIISICWPKMELKK